MPKPRILCVDDETDILLVLKTALRDDYEVSTATNGPDALAMIEEEQPDLVLLDMMMPEMDGIEVLEEIRRMPHLASLPVIFLTGVSDRAKVREALDKGTQYYLVKPFDCTELMNRVAAAIQDSRRSSTTGTTTP
jgi:CheY-like chemotaxis protein